jgi:exosortase A
VASSNISNKSRSNEIALVSFIQSRRNTALLFVLIQLTTILLIYIRTFESMVSVWFGSNTFLHGILILPMSAFMIWQKRVSWMQAAAKPSIAGMSLLLMSMLAWSVASLVSVQLVSQLAVIAMISAAIWSTLGTDVARVLRFPLLYAFFAVPFGEFLVPVLMDWTADFTVRGLQITGIPVLRAGNYFALPSGNFEVIEACSGIRFLLVTVVLGLFFSHYMFRAWAKRGIFVVLAATAVIIANWVRAYLTVLIAHLTEMKFGLGQSHIYFGWVIFLLVITLLFWFGRRYEDIDNDQVIPGNDPAMPALQADASRARSDIIIASVLALALIASGPALLELGRDRISGLLPRPNLPIAHGEWSGPEPISSGYRTAFVGASNTLAGQYSDGSKIVELHVNFYAEQQQGNELVGWQSRLFDADNWRSVRRNAVSVSRPQAEDEFSTQSILITNDRQLLQLWYWYDVGGYLTSKPRIAKLRQAWNAITGNRQGDALLVLVTPVADADSENMSIPLERFVRDNYAGMASCLRPGENTDHVCATQAAQDQSVDKH